MITLVDLELERDACVATINAAYWNFSRTARGKPPILVCPEAYKRRNELDGLIREMKKSREGLVMENLKARARVYQGRAKHHAHAAAELLRFGYEDTDAFVIAHRQASVLNYQIACRLENMKHV